MVDLRQRKVPGCSFNTSFLLISPTFHKVDYFADDKGFVSAKHVSYTDCGVQTTGTAILSPNRIFHVNQFHVLRCFNLVKQL